MATRSDINIEGESGENLIDELKNISYNSLYLVASSDLIGPINDQRSTYKQVQRVRNGQVQQQQIHHTFAHLAVPQNGHHDQQIA